MTKDKDRAETLARRAATQRRYAQRLKEAKAPGAEDLGRALLQATRACLGPGFPKTETAVWTRLFEATIDALVSQGFAPQEAHKHLLRSLHLQAPINR